MSDNQVKRKRVKVEFGKRRHPLRLRIFLFIALAFGILFVFYMFSFVELKPNNKNMPSNDR